MNKNKQTIVVVDDDEDLLKILNFAFEEQGFTVKCIKTGKEAVSYLFEPKNLEPVCLIVLDRILPDMDGIDILKQFQTQSKVQVPILILSMLASEKDVLKGFKSGAVDYMTKPFSLPILIEKARLLMAK